LSIGLAEWAPGETPEQFIARADAALYQAKREGRNRLVQSPLRESTAGPARLRRLSDH